MNKKEDVVKAIRIVTKSMDTHLHFLAHPAEKKWQKHIGGDRFHRAVTKEYAHVIRVLTDQL